MALLSLLLIGCATTRRYSPPQPQVANTTCFEFVGAIDFRDQTEQDYLSLVQPGDLVVNYMRAGRAAKEHQWLYALLPHGHSMIITDPCDFEHGLLEARFHGVRCVGISELKRCSYNLIYRLRDNQRLNLDRLNEAHQSCGSRCTRYSFGSWLAWNDNMMPDTLEGFSKSYTCSTFVAAVYHYCGVTLDAATKNHEVITPLSLAASNGVFNSHAYPAREAISKTNSTDGVMSPSPSSALRSKPIPPRAN